MPNKKLKEKLLSKGRVIEQLKTTQRGINANALGALAFKTLNNNTISLRNVKKPGLPSYGKYINPFPEFDGKIRNQDHSEFRRGFNSARKPKPLMVSETISTPNKVHHSTGISSGEFTGI